MPNDFFSKLMRFFLVLIVSLLIATILFLIWSCIQYALSPICTGFQDGDYKCSLGQYLEDFGTFINAIIIIPITFLMALPSSKNIVTLLYTKLFTLDKKNITRKSIKIIAWSFLPVLGSLVCLFFLFGIIGYFSLTSWALIIFPITYFSLYIWTSKQIKLLSKTK